MEQRESYTLVMPDCSVPLPADFDALMKWANFTRRLIAAASQNRDALLTITVQTDEGGRPVRWTSPQRQSLEPRKR